MQFTVAPLPYAKDALEPVMCQETLEFHYEKHHKGYMTMLKAAIEGKPEVEKSLEEVIKASAGGVFNSASHVYIQSFFGECMNSCGGCTPPASDVTDLINDLGRWDK